MLPVHSCHTHSTYCVLRTARAWESEEVRVPASADPSVVNEAGKRLHFGVKYLEQQ